MCALQDVSAHYAPMYAESDRLVLFVVRADAMRHARLLLPATESPQILVDLPCIAHGRQLIMLDLPGRLCKSVSGASRKRKSLRGIIGFGSRHVFYLLTN